MILGSGRRVVLAGLVALVAARPAAGAEDDRTTTTAAAVGYAAVVLAAAVPTAGNAAFWAAGEGAPRGWRLAGGVIGGADMILGGTYLALRHDTAGDVVIGAVPLALGALAVVTAIAVDGEATPPAGTVVRARILPLVTGQTAGLAVTGRF